MCMVRSAIRRAILVLAGPLLLVVPPATSAAAEPSGDELAAATHAASVAVTADGTAWFVPERGSEWKGHGHSILGSVDADGTVSERPVPGFASLDDVATSPEGDLWVSGLRGHGKEKVFKIGHLSPTGQQVLRQYTVGSAQGSRIAMAVSDDAISFVRERLRRNGPLTTIESVNIASGEVHSVNLPLGCRAYALAIASDGTPWFTQKCGGFLGDGSKSKTSISHLGPAGEIIRRPIAAKDYPVSLAGPEGTVWFGAWAYYEESHIGRLTSSGDLAEFPIPKGSPVSIAVGPDGSLWYGLIRPNYNTGGGQRHLHRPTDPQRSGLPGTPGLLAVRRATRPRRASEPGLLEATVETRYAKLMVAREKAVAAAGER